jgi:hypothetical protein
MSHLRWIYYWAVFCLTTPKTVRREGLNIVFLISFLGHTCRKLLTNLKPKHWCSWLLKLFEIEFQVPPEPAIRQHLHSAPSTGRLGAATATSSSMFCCSGDVDNGTDCDKSTFLPLTSSADDGKQLLPIQVSVL